jgi:MFS family permease
VSLLRRRAGFRRLWAAGAVSETGDWLLLIALPVYVLQLTGSALTTSTVLLVELAGTVLAGPLAGVLADRVDRRRLLIAAGLAQAVLLLPLLAVHGAGQLWIVYLVSATQAVLATVNDPVRQALLPATVEPAEIATAAAQLGVASNLARLVGGALGGALLDAYGLTGVVVADAATFVLAAALLAGWALPPVPRGGSAGAGREFLAGLAVVRADRRLRGVFAVGVLLQLAQGMFLVLFVVFVLRRLGGGASEVGLLRGMQAVGGIAGGVLLGAVARRLPPHVLAGAGCLGFGAVCLAIWNGPALTTALPAYIGLFVLIGLPISAAGAGVTTVLLAAVPEDFRGRVISTALVAGAVAQGAGTLLAGVLVDPVGLLPLLEAHAALGAVAGLVAFRTLRPPAHRPPADRPGAAAGPGAAGPGAAGSAAAEGPVAAEDAGGDERGTVRPAVVGDELVVPLQPPAGALGADRPLDHEVVRTGREPADDHVPRADPAARPDQECIPVAQGRGHGRPHHEDPSDGPPE